MRTTCSTQLSPTPRPHRPLLTMSPRAPQHEQRPPWWVSVVQHLEPHPSLFQLGWVRVRACWYTNPHENPAPRKNPTTQKNPMTAEPEDTHNTPPAEPSGPSSESPETSSDKFFWGLSRASRWRWGTLAVVTLVLYVVFVIPLWRMSYETHARENAPRAFTGTGDNIPLTQARSDALALQVRIYDALTPLGAGEWTPPAEGTPIYQAFRDTWMNCPFGKAGEFYDLASGGHLDDREAALAAVTPIAEEAGFAVAPDDQTNQPGATFYRDSDNASISLRLGATTSVVASTGCHKGAALGGWPSGTEAVPDYLRTTGRAPQAGGNGTWDD